MRPFEVLVLLANLGTAVSFFLFPEMDEMGRRGLVLAAPLLILVHVIVEKPRWQMGPAYFQALLAWLLVWTGAAPVVFANGWAVFFGVLLFILSALLPYVMSVPKLPRPTGPYVVGTRTYYLVDEGRPEMFSENGDEPRELMVQVWYPAEKPPKAKRAPYITDFEIGGPAIADRFNFPPFVIRHMNLVHTHSFVDAPLAEGDEPFPVLLFSHGFLGIRSQNTWQMEELASQGYVVVAPDHTYGAILTVFPDGRVIFGMTEPPDDMPVQTSGRLGMRQWAEDTQFILDQLAHWNEEAGRFFYGRLDLDHIGCFGHSMGGGTALQTVLNDSRCRALLLLDPWLKPFDNEEIEQACRLPLLAMMSTGDFGRENGQVAQKLAAGSPQDAYVLIIAGAGHYDYSDLPLLSPLARLFGAKGPINGRLVARIVNEYTLAFFDTYLRERPSALLEGEPVYKEVEFLVTHSPWSMKSVNQFLE